MLSVRAGVEEAGLGGVASDAIEPTPTTTTTTNGNPDRVETLAAWKKKKCTNAQEQKAAIEALFRSGASTSTTTISEETNAIITPSYATSTSPSPRTSIKRYTSHEILDRFQSLDRGG